MKTALEYFLCLQDKARDPANLHATLILGKINCRDERVGWLDDADHMQQTQAWIEELLNDDYKPIGFEVIKKDPEVFEELKPDWVNLEAEQLLRAYLKSRETRACETGPACG